MKAPLDSATAMNHMGQGVTTLREVADFIAAKKFAKVGGWWFPCIMGHGS